MAPVLKKWNWFQHYDTVIVIYLMLGFIFIWDIFESNTYPVFLKRIRLYIQWNYKNVPLEMWNPIQKILISFQALCFMLTSSKLILVMLSTQVQIFLLKYNHAGYCHNFYSMEFLIRYPAVLVLKTIKKQISNSLIIKLFNKIFCFNTYSYDDISMKALGVTEWYKHRSFV